MRHIKITKQFTNKDALSLDIYFQEVRKIDLLTIEDEIVLTRKIKIGDPETVKMLILANLRFVISIAKQYQNKGLTLSDLISEGNIGLIKAAKRYDGTRGFKFISYAVWWIRQSILLAVSENCRLVRVPLNRIGTLSKVNKAYAKLEQDYNREPTPEEIADLLQFTIKSVEESLQISNSHISLDSPLVGDEEKTLYDIMSSNNVLSPDKALDDSSLNIEIERIVATLGDYDGAILRFYFGLAGEKALSLDEIAIKMGRSRESIRQNKDCSIRRLKYNFKNGLLRPFLS